MKLFIGTAALRGPLSRYQSQFNLLEVRAEPGRVPRPSKLAPWRTQVSGDFVFSVVLPRVVGQLDASGERDAALDQAIASQQALGAAWVVLQTPPAVTPSQRTRTRLQALATELETRLKSDDGPGTVVAWEPRGLWDGDAASDLASSLGWNLVRDISREPAPPGNLVYTRLRALGEASRLRTGDLEQVADQLANRTGVCVVIEGDGAAQAARQLRALVSDDLTDDDPQDAEGS